MIRCIARHSRPLPRRAVLFAFTSTFTLTLTLGLAPGLLVATAETPPPAGAVVLRDDLNREVALPRHPQRIITLLPPFTETVCALGACDRLAATDQFSNWPARVNALPKVGAVDDAQVELIVRLKPELVLLGRSQRIGERLRELGIASFVLNTETYADIGHGVTVIGEILGVPDRAAQLNDKIEREVREVGERATRGRRGQGPTVYFEVDRAPYAAGASSFIGEILVLLGTRNIVTPDLGSFPKLNPEYVVRHNPDVIFISPADAPGLAERPGWGQIRAVKEHRLCTFPPEVRDTIVRGGPRIADGMRSMADCLARVAP